MDIKKLQAEIEETEIELRKPPPETDDPIALRSEEVSFFSCFINMILICYIGSSSTR